MRKTIASLPVPVLAIGGVALTMLGPSVVAYGHGDYATARSFLYGAILGAAATAMIAIALLARPERPRQEGALMGLVVTLTLLPAVMAVPFHAGLGTTTFFNAYMEMLSCLTTTGATFLAPERLDPALHLWRGMVGWMGGLMMLVAAAAVLGPRHLGGFEVTSSAEPGQLPRIPGHEMLEPAAARMLRVGARIAPIYLLLTLLAALGLAVLGDPALVAVMHAMAVLSTSGITPLEGLPAAPSGTAGELVVFAFLFFALSRLTMSTDTLNGAPAQLARDPEIRMGLGLILLVGCMIFLRHWIGALEVRAEGDVLAGLRAFWGGLFTAASFLTTTGFESADWDAARGWSGLGTSGVILMGLAIFGGGVATTAGGVKLLRSYILMRHGLSELRRMIHPSMVVGLAGESRRMRRQAAFIAWVAFMLFAIGLAVVMAAFALVGLDFEGALVLAVAALSTTGPLVGQAGDPALVLAQLSVPAKAVFAVAMLLGRLETLAVFALFSRELWRE